MSSGAMATAVGLKKRHSLEVSARILAFCIFGFTSTYICADLDSVRASPYRPVTYSPSAVVDLDAVVAAIGYVHVPHPGPTATPLGRVRPPTPVSDAPKMFSSSPSGANFCTLSLPQSATKHVAVVVYVDAVGHIQLSGAGTGFAPGLQVVAGPVEALNPVVAALRNDQVSVGVEAHPAGPVELARSRAGSAPAAQVFALGGVGGNAVAPFVGLQDPPTGKVEHEGRGPDDFAFPRCPRSGR